MREVSTLDSRKVLRAGKNHEISKARPDLTCRREQTIQVNALSTTLLGILLLDWMKEMRSHRKSLAHLIFVTSRDHLYPDITHWADWAANGGILHHLNREDTWPSIWKTTEPNYANSKLLVMYAIEELCARALDSTGE